MRRLVLAFSALLCAAPAHAEWYRASSRHFVIYSEQKPEALREFAEHLEKFDAAVRRVRAMADLPPSEGNRVTIFSLSDPDQIQRLIGDKSGMVRGYYRGSAAGSVAFVSRGNQQTIKYTPTGTRRSSKIELGMRDDTLLYHEYAHHLMMQDLVSPVPRWFIEGFAEFMSTAQVERDGSVGLGRPATHRYAGLVRGMKMSLKNMLSGTYKAQTQSEAESLYGQGWLLTHYLTFEPSRKGQLEAYLSAIAKNVPASAAAATAFGDLGTLDSDLDKYLNRSTLRYVSIAKEALNIGPIDIRPLGPSGSAIVPVLIEARNGLDAAEAEKLALKARSIEARFPGDPLVETTLAEIELDAKQPKAAEQAASRALAANPKHLDATILFGKALATQAEALQGAERRAMFDRARKTFSAANAIDREDPEPMMEFYQTFGTEGIAPNANAVAALHYASELAPQDSVLRMNSALRYLYDGKLDDARRSLVPIAFNPHGGNYADYARDIFLAIDAGDKEKAIQLAQAGPSKD